MNFLERGQKILDDIATKAHAQGAVDGEALTLGRALSRRLARPLTDTEQQALRKWFASTDLDHAIDEVFNLQDATEATRWLERLVTTS